MVGFRKAIRGDRKMAKPVADRVVRWLLPAAIIVLPVAAWAQDGKQPGEDITVVGKKEKPEKKVCKRSTETGSIIPRMVCKDEGEWERIRERSVAAVEEVQQNQEALRHSREIYGDTPPR